MKYKLFLSGTILLSMQEINKPLNWCNIHDTVLVDQSLFIAFKGVGAFRGVLWFSRGKVGEQGTIES